jgi:nitrogenase molybdenum-iron protein alpha chain
LLGLKAHHFDCFAEPIFAALGNVDEVPFSVATNQPFEQANIVNRLGPDVLIVHVGGNNIAAKHGLPILPLFGPTYNYCGYSGTFEVARRLNKTLRNSQFNQQIARNTSMPFRTGWFERDPFSYIKYGESGQGSGAGTGAGHGG